MNPFGRRFCVLVVGALMGVAAESDGEFPFPLIDLEAWTIEEVQEACQEIGFFAIRNHGVNATVLNDVWKATEEFFDLPLDAKLQSKTKNETHYPYGYERSETLALSLSPHDRANALPDWKETFSLGPHNPHSGMPAPRYPAQPPQLKSALQSYYREMERLAATLLRMFAVVLRLPEPDRWFDDKMDRHLSALRLVNYWETSGTRPREQLRAGAHTDYGALTILKSGGPGLQVWMAHRNQWVDVPAGDNVFVVNLGDLMQRWTNDQWVSTLHRVVLLEQPHNARRQSIAYFVNVNGDTQVETLQSCITPDRPKKYPTITAKDHLMAKHLASMGETRHPAGEEL